MKKEEIIDAFKAEWFGYKIILEEDYVKAFSKTGVLMDEVKISEIQTQLQNNKFY